MKERHSVYKNIYIYHDPNIPQYSCTYKKYYFASDNIKEVKKCIDMILAYEKAMKNNIDSSQK